MAVLDWKWGKESQGNREMVSYARAHGFLVDERAEDPLGLVVTSDKVYLLKSSAATIRDRLRPNIVSPPGGDMVR